MPSSIRVAEGLAAGGGANGNRGFFGDFFAGLLTALLPCLLAGFCAEDGHQPVAQILVDFAVVAADGLAHRGEQAVENEYDVVGQARLADGSESPRIEEQNGESALHALLMR